MCVDVCAGWGGGAVSATRMPASLEIRSTPSRPLCLSFCSTNLLCPLDACLQFIANTALLIYALLCSMTLTSLICFITVQAFNQFIQMCFFFKISFYLFALL